MTAYQRFKAVCLGIALCVLWIWACPGIVSQIFFPAVGEGMEQQDLRTPAEVGLDGRIIDALQGTAQSWALWRDGYLVHVKGSFNAKQDAKSVRKTIYGIAIGAALEQGRLASLDVLASRWLSLSGKDRDATVWHLITQSAGFDYPYSGDHHDYAPGEMWTASELHIAAICTILSKLYGHSSFRHGFGDTMRRVLFDAIGMRGWTSYIKAAGESPRFALDLEDLGRLGLLMVADGVWDGDRLLPPGYVAEMETKQTRGMRVNYAGPHDGVVDYTRADFPEAPYGYLTWTNADRDVWPDAGAGWAWAHGALGHFILWNRSLGIVYAAFESEDPKPPERGWVPELIEENVTGPDPLR